MENEGFNQEKKIGIFEEESGKIQIRKVEKNNQYFCNIVNCHSKLIKRFKEKFVE